MNIYYILVLHVLFVTQAFGNNLVSDPLADFLVLPIKDRYTDASEVVRVHRITVDIDGDGAEDQFLGHNMMWWGDNHAWYGAFYKPVSNGFTRLTPSDKAIGIDHRFFGPRETSFVGYVEEKKGQGILVLANDFITPNPTDPGKPPVQPDYYSARRFYHIHESSLIVEDLGPLDLHTSEGKAFFNRYFGESVKSRPIRFEDFTAETLKELGYTIPNWKETPESLLAHTPPQSNGSSILADVSTHPRVPMPPTPNLINSTAPSVVAEATQASSSLSILLLSVLAIVFIGVIVILFRRRSP